ncbi:MAG TPA: glutaredoxin domain-containing protein [Candidatus Baltobacteraceae bacterium]|jgi:glutaredoxin 3
MPLELYGSRTCPYTAQLRADLEWNGEPFVEFDVDEDAQACARMLDLVSGAAMLPVLVRDGSVAQIGYQGRGCYVNRS